MRKFLMMGLLCCGLQARAQYAGFTAVKNTGDFKKTFATATAATESIEADFTQEKTLSMLTDKIRSTGKFWFRKKDRLRMEYIKPFTYLMILNNGRIYIRDGNRENKISANSNKVFQQVNRILIDCVNGTMLDNADFQSAIFESAGTYLLELRPVTKNLRELYQKINITVDKKNNAVSSLEMVELAGDKTIIRFQNKKLNATIPDSVFNIP